MATEKRLIDANEAIERAKNSDKIVGSSIWETGEVVEFLEDCPIVEAVEVVRCKDCISGKGSTHKVCPLYKQGLMKDDDYCSVGERRTNAN